MKKTLITGGKIVSEKGLSETDVLISVERAIEALKPDITPPKNTEVIDARGKLLFPTFIDCHVHFREPGLTHKATMQTESEAALAGGIGTVCEMPNTVPATTSLEALADKVRCAASVDRINIKFFFGVTEAAHLNALQKLWSADSLELKRLKSHCSGVKIYMDHSTGNQGISSGVIEDVFSLCGKLKIPLVAHCEDPEINEKAKKEAANAAAHSLSRPPESEARAIERALSLAAKHSTPLHIAHLSTLSGVELVRSAKKDGLSVTCEAAPHHLFFTTDDYSRLGSLIKVNPPVRSKDDRDALWAAILDGTIDCIASDHAPHALEEKKSAKPPSGIPGMELMIPLLLTAASGRWPNLKSAPPPASRLGYQDIYRLCFVNPNKIFGLNAPPIAKGQPANIVMIDPEKEFTVTPVNLHGKSGWTPYEAWTLTGKIERVIL